MRTGSPELLVLLLLALAAGLSGPGTPLAAQGSGRAPKPLVVIDAGHGGVDPGARGPGGVREKDVSLAVARELASLLREDPSLEVRMTRERDTLIALRDRPRMANRWRGDERPALFISIHANAHAKRTIRGFETYFLSEAESADARRVAEMENAAVEYERDGGAAPDDLSFIFKDLRQNYFLRESSEGAARIQRGLADVLSGPNRGVKQAGFVVLEGAEMPAVLVEIGFITNPAEETLLRGKDGQGKIARGLARAVQDFLDRQASAKH